MSNFVNMVHPDLPGQLSRVATVAVPNMAARGWAIAKDDDLGPHPTSSFVEAAKADLAAARAEAAAEDPPDELAALKELVEANAPEEPEDEKPKPKPKPKAKAEEK